MKRYVAFVLVFAGVIGLIVFWIADTYFSLHLLPSFAYNVLLLFPFLFIIVGVGLYVLFKKRTSLY